MHYARGTAIAVLILASSASFAQTPEKMPFDIPYGTPIGYEQAIKLVDAAAAEAKKRNWKMNIAVATRHKI
jgi:hypothetical protein